MGVKVKKGGGKLGQEKNESKWLAQSTDGIGSGEAKRLNQVERE